MTNITIKVDGVPVTVPAGTNVVDAAREAGIAIPVFCYHPRMQAVGMCRMCLVGVSTPKIDRATRQPVLDDDGNPVIARMPKLQTACTTMVSEGMEIDTQGEDVKFAQNGVLEFLLTSHPLDCPVCDKGGECPLQNLTMEWGPGNSRFDYTNKVHFEKPVPLGDLIYLDRERCILCSRCVRFQDEMVDDPVLGFSSRGRAWHIISKSDPGFDSKFSGNTTDICPVGALTTADFRFKARSWELESKPSICTLCPVGCNISLDTRHNQIKRVMPRENSAVNDIWICDRGRFGHHFIESEQRITTPMIRDEDGVLQPATWAEATTLVAEKLAAIHQDAGGSAIAGLAGTHLCNEDLYTFQKLIREQLGSNNLDCRTGTPGEPDTHDTIGAQLGVGVGTNLMPLGKGTAVLVFGADPEEEAPIYKVRLRQIALHGGQLIVANHRPTKLDNSATTTLHYRPGTAVWAARALLQALLVSMDGEQPPQGAKNVGDLRATFKSSTVANAAQAAGVDAAAIEAIVATLREAENVLIVYGADARAGGAAVPHTLASLLLLTGKAGQANSGVIALLPGGNSRGALDMGVRPDMAPGYQPVKQPGLAARDMWQAAHAGQVQAFYLMGSDPARANPAAATALDAASFVVVQDMLLTATAQHADVVLPAASLAEYDSTFTNAERRVQRARQAMPVQQGARPGWAIVQEIGDRLSQQVTATPVALASRATAKGNTRKAKGGDSTTVAVAEATTLFWDYITPGEVAAEIAERVPGYAGITHEALGKTGKQGTWGRQTNEAVYYDGTSYENTEGVGLSLVPLVADEGFSFDMKPLMFDLPVTDEQYPLLLLTPPVLYNSDPLMVDSRLLTHIPEAAVALHSSDAARLGVNAGDLVTVESAVGSLTMPARVVPDLPAGTALIPAGLDAAPLAMLQTGTQTRVAIRRAQPTDDAPNTPAPTATEEA